MHSLLGNAVFHSCLEEVAFVLGHQRRTPLSWISRLLTQDLPKPTAHSQAVANHLAAGLLGAAKQGGKKREKEREHLGEDFPHVAKALRPAWRDCLWVSCRDGGRVVPLSTARVTGLELALEFTGSGVQTRTVYQLSDVNKIRNTLTLGEEAVFLRLFCFCFYLTRKPLQILRI